MSPGGRSPPDLTLVVIVRSWSARFTPGAGVPKVREVGALAPLSP